MNPLIAVLVLLLPECARPQGVMTLTMAASWLIGQQWGRRLVRSLVARLGLASPVALVLAALPALAYASPPDPTWIAGIYDDADYDDVVVLVSSSTGTVVPVLPADLPPILAFVGTVPSGSESVDPDVPEAIAQPRAPPSS